MLVKKSRGWILFAILGLAGSLAVLALSYELKVMKSEIVEQNIQANFEQAKLKTKQEFDALQKELTSSLWFRIRAMFRLWYVCFIFTPLLLLAPFALSFPSAERWWWWLLNRILSKLGGCWIKLGQWASTRPDLFSPENTRHLSQLVDQCPCHDIAATESVLMNGLGGASHDLFRKIGKKPVASGAVAQVHVATLRDGTKAAVKVLHPSIRASMAMDLTVMGMFKDLLLLLPGSEWLGLNDALEQFESSMRYQTNLRIEGINLNHFRHNFRNETGVVFPSALMISEDALVESFEAGLSLSRYLEDSNANPEEKKHLAKLGLAAFLKMMLIDNLVHADLHSGNILVKQPSPTPTTTANDSSPAASKPSLVFLDVGLVARASAHDFQLLKWLLLAVAERDSRKAASLMVEHAKEKRIDPEELDNYVSEMGEIFEFIFKSKMNEIDVGMLLGDVLATNRKYRVQFAGNFSTLCVGVIVLEGIGKQLDPDINLLQEAVPYLVRKETNERLSNLRERVRPYIRPAYDHLGYLV